MNRFLPPRRFPRRSALAMACLLASLPAFAAEAAADSATDADVTTLDKVSVKGERAEGYSVRKTTAGTRFELAPREIPQSVSIISHQRIEDQGLDDIIDVLENTTGVSNTRSDSERFEFYARGFYIDNYQFDGIPTTMVQNWSYGDSALDLALYDRVEVVRGATGLMTGAGNPSASVNLIRKHADSDVLAGSVQVSAGSWGRTRTTVDVSTPLNASGTVRARVIGSYLDTDSYVDRYRQNKTLGYAVIDADLTPDTQLSVGYDYQKKQSDGVTWGGFPLWYSDGSRTDYSRSFNPAADWTFWDTTTKRAFATLQHDFASGWKLKLNATHDQTNVTDKLFYPFYTIYGFDKNTGAGVVPYSGYYITERKVDGLDGYAEGPFQLFGREHELMAGVSYNRRRYVNDGAFDFPAPMASYLNWTGDYPEPTWSALSEFSRGTVTQKAGYAAARFSLADPLKLIVGARYTDWKVDGAESSVPYSSRQQETTPYAGLVYTIDAVWSAYASYTDIFQPQTSRTRSGAYLDPVIGKSYEAGVKAAWFDDRLNASLSVFRIEQDNVAQATTEFVPGTTETAYVAAQGTVSRGFEFEVNGELAPGWNGTFGAARYVAKDAGGADINAQLPQTTLKLYTSYTPRSLTELTFGGGVNWQNRIYYVDATYGRFEQDAYALVSAFARYRLSEEFSVQANLNNLLDKTYYAQIYGYGAWGEPRSGSLSFTWSF
ncbi:ferric-rhodotorulic acid/ferric-coprogen receptor FhuE [Xanthomonas hyacinthi]|uniref:TonB-dependent siderophore receptor n=1 Tax=Xanthomonas hyacinthi TaxID=56455 RepID=A0A2S7EQ57_9XANT|nr:ferric-rhodotorulic acid/ferric-coprogen receptor FhuE [Xanthomonas hyacinthi]KLD76503.1 ferric-rhodotorulic acid transporter [Xanthomonas hyacinthi DSM 19077]PPU95246.1 TonB-dependent siderophore receptor [Xanthomonas hyacinthi]QGY76916.1 ferric-rhodotorulic acid/ferric-coprogen receptor FhuE [Xanthomonas hyacinthi]